jgi:NAD-dependent deacetylase
MNLIGRIQQAVEILRQSEHVIVFSGAGMSAESGIPTFRDPGGVWDRFDPEELGTAAGLLHTLTRHPDRIRDFVENAVDIFLSARPNPGHLALGTLERMGILRTVITQNVDNLHQDAGNSRVLEIHGNLFRQQCLACGRKKLTDKKSFLLQIRRALGEIETLDLPSILRELPQCPCGSPMRPDVVMFGEQVHDLYECFLEADNCSAMLVLGTSGVVYPAAALPQKAKEAGAMVIEINPGDSIYSGISDVRIPEKTGRILPEIVERLQHA